MASRRVARPLRAFSIRGSEIATPLSCLRMIFLPSASEGRRAERRAHSCGPPPFRSRRGARRPMPPSIIASTAPSTSTRDTPAATVGSWNEPWARRLLHMLIAREAVERAMHVERGDGDEHADRRADAQHARTTRSTSVSVSAWNPATTSMTTSRTCTRSGGVATGWTADTSIRGTNSTN